MQYDTLGSSLHNDNINLNDENVNKRIIEENSVREYTHNTTDSTQIQRYNTSY